MYVGKHRSTWPRYLNVVKDYGEPCAQACCDILDDVMEIAMNCCGMMTLGSIFRSCWQWSACLVAKFIRAGRSIRRMRSKIFYAMRSSLVSSDRNSARRYSAEIIRQTVRHDNSTFRELDGNSAKKLPTPANLCMTTIALSAGRPRLMWMLTLSVCRGR